MKNKFAIKYGNQWGTRNWELVDRLEDAHLFGNLRNATKMLNWRLAQIDRVSKFDESEPNYAQIVRFLETAEVWKTAEVVEFQVELLQVAHCQ